MKADFHPELERMFRGSACRVVEDVSNAELHYLGLALVGHEAGTFTSFSRPCFARRWRLVSGIISAAEHHLSRNGWRRAGVGGATRTAGAACFHWISSRTMLKAVGAWSSTLSISTDTTSNDIFRQLTGLHVKPSCKQTLTYVKTGRLLSSCLCQKEP